MAWFRCFIRGEDFPGQVVGESGPVGFYVTRFVEAADAREAEAIAFRSLRAQPKLAPPTGVDAVGAGAGVLRGDRGAGRRARSGRSAGVRLVPDGERERRNRSTGPPMGRS